jgi:hypothetical protein
MAQGGTCATSAAYGESGACRWATVESWLWEEDDKQVRVADRQVCLRCGAARLVRAADGLDGQIAGCALHR